MVNRVNKISMDKEKVQSGLLQASVAGAMIAIDLSTTGGLGTLIGAIGGGVMSNQVGSVLEKAPELIRKKIWGDPDAGFTSPSIETYSSAIIQALDDLEKEFLGSAFTSQEKKEVRKFIYDTKKQVKDYKSIALDSQRQLSLEYGDLTPPELESTFQSQLSQVIEEWKKNENLSPNSLEFIATTLPGRLTEKLNAVLVKNPQVRQDLAEYYLETLIELNEQNSGVFSEMFTKVAEIENKLLREIGHHNELLKSLIRKVVQDSKDDNDSFNRILSKVEDLSEEIQQNQDSNRRIEEKMNLVLSGHQIDGLESFEFVQLRLKDKEALDDKIQELTIEEQEVAMLLKTLPENKREYLSKRRNRISEQLRELFTKQSELLTEIEEFIEKLNGILPDLSLLVNDHQKNRIQSLIEKGKFEEASGLLNLEDLEKKSEDLANEYFLKGRLEIGALGNDSDRFDKCRHYFEKGIEIADTYKLNLEFGHLLRVFGYLEESRERYEKVVGLAKSRLEYFEAMTELLSLLSIFGSSEDEVLFTQSIDECRKEAESDTSLVSELSNFFSSYGIFLGTNRRDQEAITYLKEALELSEQIVDRGNQKNLKKLAARYHNLAEKLHTLGDLPGAKEQFQKALKIYRQLDSNDPDNIVIKRRIAGTFDSYASLLKDLKEYMASELYYREAIKIRNLLAKAFPQSEFDSLANSFSNLGQLLGEQGHYWEAKDNLGKAISMRNMIIANLGANSQSLARLALSEITMGWVLIHEKSKLAIGYLDAAYRNFTEASKHHSPSFLVNVANAHRHLGMYSASVEPDRVLAINHLIEAGGLVTWLNRRWPGGEKFRNLILGDAINLLGKLGIPLSKAEEIFLKWANKRDKIEGRP